jgi:hypothetical protein
MEVDQGLVDDMLGSEPFEGGGLDEPVAQENGAQARRFEERTG